MHKTAHWREKRWMSAPWCFVGYLAAIGEHGCWPSWMVWWNPETDRVWLKREGR